MAKKIYRGEALVGGLNMGGSAIKAFKTGTADVPYGVIGSGTSGTAEVLISGVADGDVVFLMPPADLPDGLVFTGSNPTAAGTVSAYLLNGGASATTAGAANQPFAGTSNDVGSTTRRPPADTASWTCACRNRGTEGDASGPSVVDSSNGSPSTYSRASAA